MFLALVAPLLTRCAAPPSPRADGASPPPRQSPATAVVVLSREPWSFGAVEGQAIQTPHYRIFTTERDPALVSRLPAFLEGALGHYRSAIVKLPEPRQLMDVYLLDNRPQWRRLARWRLGRAADVYLRMQRGGFAAGGVAYYFDIGPADTFALAAHEGWHQYTQSVFRTPLPAPLEEALATWMEGKRARPDGGFDFLPWANLERFDALRRAAGKNALLPLEQLLSLSSAQAIASDAVDPLVYYAQLWALVHFLLEGDEGALRPALGAMLLDAAAGTLHASGPPTAGAGAAAASSPRSRAAALLIRYTGRPLPALNASYQRFIGRLVTPGARSAIAQGRSPLR